MPKVTISDSQGLVQSSGSGVEINSAVTFSSLPVASVSAITSNSTVSSPGVYTISGSGVPALAVTLPLASSVPGGLFVFRSASPDHAHFLTGSAETNGTKVFAGHPGATPDNQGSKLTLAVGVGSSVALICDGKSFLVSAVSGSCTIAGT